MVGPIFTILKYSRKHDDKDHQYIHVLFHYRYSELKLVRCYTKVFFYSLYLNKS